MIENLDWFRYDHIGFSALVHISFDCVRFDCIQLGSFEFGPNGLDQITLRAVLRFYKGSLQEITYFITYQLMHRSPSFI